jgi:Ras-related protein Rab-1A
VTDSDTFSHLSTWLGEIEKYGTPDVAKVIIGNKADCVSRKVVEYTTAAEFASEKNIPFLETSAKTDHNINETFTTLIDTILSRFLAPINNQRLRGAGQYTQSARIALQPQRHVTAHAFGRSNKCCS